MADRLKGKRALVTAAGQGIGRASALAFAAEGARVIATDINPGALKELKQAAQGEIATRLLDVTDAAAIATLARDLGAIDVLFNCAGFVHHGTVLTTSEEDWDAVLAVNLHAPFLLCKFAAQSMVKRGAGGKIINVTSLAAFMGSDIFPSYSVTKGGLTQLTRSLAIELAPHNIQVNALVPGWFTTDMTEWIRTGPEYEWLLKEMVQRTPRGRFGEPGELKGAAVFLASRASDHMTGADLVIDGGMSIR